MNGLKLVSTLGSALKTLTSLLDLYVFCSELETTNMSNPIVICGAILWNTVKFSQNDLIYELLIRLSKQLR